MPTATGAGLPVRPPARRTRVTDPIEDLRATADDLAADADRLKEIEEKKATLQQGDPALVESSDEAERLAEDMATKARVQSHLAEDASGGDGAAGAEGDAEDAG